MAHTNGHRPGYAVRRRTGYATAPVIPPRGGGLAQLLRAYDLDGVNSGRVAQLIRAYRKHVRGGYPTTIQRQLIKRAAVLTAKAEVCVLDPQVSLEDIVRVDHAAQRARTEMVAALARTTEDASPPSTISLEKLLEAE
jgi:hypothetical protein